MRAEGRPLRPAHHLGHGAAHRGRALSARALWDRLIQRTGKGVTFEDVPALAHLEAPDESRLDYAGALEFTRFLAGVLSAKPATGVARDVP